MRKLTYGEHLYNYLSSLDYEGLNFDEAEARKWASEADALLRVARAAYAYDYCNDDDVERKKRLLLRLREAIKEVKHLLEVDK